MTKDFKVFVLNVFSVDNHDVFVFDSLDKCLNKIEDTIKDNYHFDTDTPYITKEELAEELTEMKCFIYDDGVYESGDLTFTVDERYVD